MENPNEEVEEMMDQDGLHEEDQGGSQEEDQGGSQEEDQGGSQEEDQGGSHEEGQGGSQEEDQGGSQEVEDDGDDDDGEDEDEDDEEADKKGSTEETNGSSVKRSRAVSKYFKLEVTGLPKYFKVKDLKRYVNRDLKLEAYRVKPSGFWRNMAYLSFTSEDLRQNALKKLRRRKWRRCILQARIKPRGGDPPAEEANNDEAAEDDDGLTVEEKVTKFATPLAHLSYEEQLVEKEKSVQKTLSKYGSELAEANSQISDWLHWQKVRRGGLICEVDKIVPSPVIEAYRNKCEFIVGLHPASSEPTVGFRLSRKGDSVSVGPIDHLRHIPDSMKVAVRVFEQYVRASSHKPYDPTNGEGVWRQLTVRTSNNSDVLIIVVLHPQGMTTENLTELKESIVKFFTEEDGSEANVTSIFYQAQAQKKPDETEDYEHLWGEKTITETILGKKFRVSADAFLKENTSAAEIIYSKIDELADLDQTNILFDLYSGPGTVGIALAEECFKVYGVEMIKNAVEDANFNASANCLANVNYCSGLAEEVLHTVASSAEQYHAIGVVDPPKEGLNYKVSCTLRKCFNMKRLVYVSGDPKSTTKNIIELGRPQSTQYRGEFFIPIKAIPVDLFPHTHQYELIILFERWDALKWRRIMEGNPLPKDEEYYKSLPVLSAEEMQEMEKKVQAEEDKVKKENQGKEEELGLKRKGKQYYKHLKRRNAARANFWQGGQQFWQGGQQPWQGGQQRMNFGKWVPGGGPQGNTGSSFYSGPPEYGYPYYDRGYHP